MLKSRHRYFESINKNHTGNDHDKDIECEDEILVKKREIFSNRMGFSESQPIQIDGIDHELSADIFNFLWRHFFGDAESTVYSREDNINSLLDVGAGRIFRSNQNFRNTWTEFFHFPLSDFTDGVDSNDLEPKYAELKWYKKYDLLEFAINELERTATLEKLYREVNTSVLSENNSGYRFVHGALVAVSKNVDLKNLTKSANSSINAGHFDKAIKELAKRKNRNNNQIAVEAMNGVESAAKAFVRDKIPDKDYSKESLGILLKAIDNGNFLTDHKAYSESMNKLFGYLSDAGFRHGNTKEQTQDLSLNEAIYILEVCSAFANYLASELQD